MRSMSGDVGIITINQSSKCAAYKSKKNNTTELVVNSFLCVSELKWIVEKNNTIEYLCNALVLLFEIHN